MVESILLGIIEKYRLTQGFIYDFLDIDVYHKFQGSKETCATNTWDKLTSLRLTDQFPGGPESFINQWYEGIEELRYL